MSSFAIAVLPTSLGGSPASPLKDAANPEPVDPADLSAIRLYLLNLKCQNPELSQAAKDCVEQAWAHGPGVGFTHEGQQLRLYRRFACTRGGTVIPGSHSDFAMFLEI